MSPSAVAAVDAEAPILRGGGMAAWICLFVGVAAGAVMVWAFVAHPARAFHSYLTAYAFTLSLVIGSAAFIMMGHAANATWPVAVRRLGEAAAAPTPLLLVLFAPVVGGLGNLYPWMHPEHYAEPTRRMLEHRQPYMNPGFFAGRALFYLLVWSLFAWLLRRWSLASDHGSDPERQHVRLRRLSYAGLPIMALTSGFAAFDWFMSLAPEFSSTMFGALWIAMCLFGGTACIVLLTALARAAGLHSAGPSHVHALGRLLFAFLIFLGYTSFFQFMLVWIANKPSEAVWYVERSHGAYFWGSVFLVLGHFFLPFFALLSFGLKRRLSWLAAIAGWCLFSQYLHLHWTITPSSSERGFAWLDLIALLAVLGLTLSFGLWLQRGRLLAPVGDPVYRAALRYRSR